MYNGKDKSTTSYRNSMDGDREREKFNLDVSGSKDSDNSEDEYVLTQAVLSQNICQICQHFHNREDTTQDITIEPVTDNIDLVSAWPGAADFNQDFLSKLESYHEGDLQQWSNKASTCINSAVFFLITFNSTIINAHRGKNILPAASRNLAKLM